MLEQTLESISPLGGGDAEQAMAASWPLLAGVARNELWGSDLDGEGTYTRSARWGFT
jgi:hypothetical protein